MTSARSTVRLWLEDDGAYVTLLASGHQAETDFERECREWTAARALEPGPFLITVPNFNPKVT